MCSRYTVQKGQIWVMGTVTLSAKRSNPPCSRHAVGMQYAVGVSAKGSTHTVGYAVGAQCTVCMQ